MKCGAVFAFVILASAVVMAYLTREILPTYLSTNHLVALTFENNWRTWGANDFKTEEPKETKLVLHWTTFYGRLTTLSKDWYKKRCSVSSCVGTMNRTRLSEADAVVFHHFRNHWPKGDLPNYRSPNQLYVAWIGEPATYTWTAQRLNELPVDFFNISMTYRLGSHIPILCVTTKPRQTEQRNIEARVKNHPKKKLVAWFVSHCKTSSDRESYVKELQKYIDVDIYGACGPLKCGTKKSRPCYEMLERDYKFYLGFENSICKDYVTEKLGRILLYDVIPVTLGGANYSQMAPPHSHINALDFKSPRHLARYLHGLAKNDTEYFKYFKWKVNYSVKMCGYGFVTAYCKLCALLNGKVQYKSHKDFKSWWNPLGVCKQGNFSY